MEEVTKKAAAETPAQKPKSRYKFIGQRGPRGFYLPDAITLVNPDTVSDEDIDTYLKRYPKLRGKVWEDAK